jgi:hypothetical protein
VSAITNDAAFEARPSQLGLAIKSSTNNNARPLIPPHLQLFFQAISSTAQIDSSSTAALGKYASSVADSRSAVFSYFHMNDDREKFDSPVTVIKNDTLPVLLVDAEGAADSAEMDFEPLDAWFAFSTAQQETDLSEC